jgi:hypothetical protein
MTVVEFFPVDGEKFLMKSEETACGLVLLKP